VELRSVTHALCVSSQMVHSAGTHKPAFTTSTFSELTTNRRMPNGMYGGVRGWGREAPAYSILAVFHIDRPRRRLMRKEKKWPADGTKESHYSDQMDLDKIVDLKPMVETMSKGKEVNRFF